MLTNISIIKILSFQFKAYYSHFPSAIYLHNKNFMEYADCKFQWENRSFYTQQDKLQNPLKL